MTSISFLWLVMTLPRESYSREIRSKNKSVYENARRDRNIVELHAPTHRLLEEESRAREIVEMERDWETVQWEHLQMPMDMHANEASKTTKKLLPQLEQLLQHCFSINRLFLWHSPFLVQMRHLEGKLSTHGAGIMIMMKMITIIIILLLLLLLIIVIIIIVTITTIIITSNKAYITEAKNDKRKSRKAGGVFTKRSAQRSGQEAFLHNLYCVW